MFAGFTATNFEKLGGLYNFLFTEDVPDGFSPALQNVRFKPGAVESRPGIGSGAWSKPASIFYGLAQFLDNLGNQHNLTLDQNGSLDQQNFTAPGTSVTSVYPGLCLPGSRLSTTNLNNRIYMAFYQEGVTPGGSLVSLDSNGNLDPVAPLGPATKDHLSSTGQITAGSAIVTNVTQIQTWCVGDLIGDSQNAIVGPHSTTSVASVTAVDSTNATLTLSQTAVTSSNLGEDGLTATLFYPLLFVSDDAVAGQIIEATLDAAGSAYQVGDVLSITPPSPLGPIQYVDVDTGGTGYNVGDSFTVNNSISGAILASGQVATVTSAGGTATAVIINTLGSLYAVATGVATTTTSGGGSGLTLDILSITPGTSAVGGSITVTSVNGSGGIVGYTENFANSYGWYGTTGLTLVGGHGSGATIDIFQVADSTYTSGNISQGLHGVAVSFQTRSGAYTEPCAMCFWQSAGNRSLAVYWNTMAYLSPLLSTYNPVYQSAVFMFTQADDDDIYQIPASLVGLTESNTYPLLFNFYDTDLTGGDLQTSLYDNQRMSDQSGLTQYNSRLVTWGEFANEDMAGLDLLGITGPLVNNLYPYGILGTSALASGGTGYNVGDNFTINSPLVGVSLAIGSVLTEVGGVVQTYSIVSAGGQAYQTGTGIATTALTGGGSGLTINITALATPFTVPIGWEPGTNNGGAVSSQPGQGAPNWSPGARPVTAFTGDGQTATLGEIWQSEAANVLSPNTSYTVRFWAKNVNVAGGGLQINLHGTGIGVGGIGHTAGFTLTAADFTAPNPNGWQQFVAQICTATDVPQGSGPNGVTPDLRLRIALVNTVSPYQAAFFLSRLQIYPTNTAYSASVVRFSDAFNADRFDDLSGYQQVAKDNGEAVTSCVQLRWYFYIYKERSMYVTFDDGQNPPSLWTSNLVESAAGAGGPNATVGTDSYIIAAARPGAYIFFGGKPMKLSQEIQTTWETINWAAASNIHVILDPQLHLVYFFLPTGVSTVPNSCLILDWTEGLGQEDEPGGRKWGYDLYPVNIYASMLGETPESTQGIWFAGTSVASPGTAKVYLQGNQGDLDDGLAVDSFYETSYARATPNGTSLFGGLAFTTAGSGTLLVSLLPLGSQAGDTRQAILQPQILTLPLNKDVEVYANLESERARARFECNRIQPTAAFPPNPVCDYFQVRRVGIFAAPWAPQRLH